MNDNDRKHGFASPKRGPLEAHVRAAMSALECGLRTQAWDCVEDAFVLCEEIMVRLNGEARS